MGDTHNNTIHSNIPSAPLTAFMAFFTTYRSLIDWSTRIIGQGIIVNRKARRRNPARHENIGS
ncbi:hypothetical protein GCM10007157_15130 [Vreelandella hamiltonii]|uniref:Uncharacterized protein n=1 Tax=Vreelandella hamiltonii TaxID=502829 RepID=A0A8H9LZH1_9GAMM|nr:hypothetical protein GCM10007157_15130 [Halomonas hamiltonii]